MNLALWVLCEIAIAACDLAEVLGAAIGLNLLFHIPLLAGVLITAADTLLLLWFQSFGIRTIEAVVLSLITVIGGLLLRGDLLGQTGGERTADRAWRRASTGTACTWPSAFWAPP